MEEQVVHIIDRFGQKVHILRETRD